MKKLMSMLAVGTVAATLLLAPAAQAVTSTPVTLDVTVNSTLTVTINTSSVSFGNLNAGVTSSGQPVSYTVATNNPAGYTVEARTEASSTGIASVTFQLQKDGSGTWEAFPTSGGSAIGSYTRTVNSAGEVTYTDQARVVIGTTAPTGAKTRQFVYLVTAL